LAESRESLCEYVARRIPADLRTTLDADDLVQQAHIQVFRRITAFEVRGPDAFHRWVATIALHKLRDAIRHRRAARRAHAEAAVTPHGPSGQHDDSVIALLDIIEGTDQTPSRSAARHEAVAAVESAVAALPDDQRQAVSLVYLQGCSVAAAAEAMRRSEQAIHGLCYRARGQLREYLGTRSRFLSSRD
jgi:RNA polymerase sigma-70 factor, ECF subfamily